MPEQHAFDYAIIRIVPHEERGEFVNAGVILFCRACKFLDARLAFDPQRVRTLAPEIDVEMVRQHLDLVPRLCAGGADAGPIGALSLAERFRWIVSPRNTIVQTSPIHSGLCADPAAMLEHLLDTMVK
jgi:hypothetical protein